MQYNKIFYFLRILAENEPFIIQKSPFDFGISLRCARRILEAFSIKILNQPLAINVHYGKISTFYKINFLYIYTNNSKKMKTYSLIVEIKKRNGLNKKHLNKFLKEYIYLKLIVHILFEGTNMALPEIINRIKG